MARPVTQEVIVELPTGARVGVVTAERAAQLYPGATILSYGDGRPYDGPAVSKQPDQMTREELNTYAASVGVTAPERFRNKADLTAAIEAATAPASDPATTGTGPDSGETDGDADES